MLSALVIILFLTIIRLILSPAIIYTTTSWLEKQDIDAEIEDVRINIIDGSISLLNATGIHDRQTLFNIGLIDIHWNWTPLSDKAIQVTAVTLDNLDINIKQYTDSMIIGGVSVPLSSSESAAESAAAGDKADKETENTEPWSASLGTIMFTNLNICYLQHQAKLENANAENKILDYCIQTQEISWNGTVGYAIDKNLDGSSGLPISSTGTFLLKGLTVHDNKLDANLLFSESNTLKNVRLAGLNSIQVENLEMNTFSALQRDDDKHKDAVRFSQLKINDIRLNDLNSLSLNSISIDDPGLYIVKNDSAWEYQKWLTATAVNDGHETGSVQANNKTSAGDRHFDIELGDITIKNSDFCYLEQKSKLYYCFTAQLFDWQGSAQHSIHSNSQGDIKLTIDADLTLNQARIHSYTLERNLLTLGALKLKKLRLSGLSDVSLDKFTLDRLTALQRSKNKKDNSLSFKSFTITDVNATASKASMNTIRLYGLASNISKDTDGQWEHDKWLTKKDNDTVENKSKAKKDPAVNPYRLSIKQIDIKTDEKLLFTDNSTKPETVAGLQRLSFRFDDLDADKPDRASPFSLSAKTTRDGTIEVQGDIKPMSEKLSFDAKGKLKGLDLRAASPLVNKAIGHIIKSGQLDADLKLKATDGILDSNIALSLYHFNIRPNSQEDADKLDKLFGLPLNQSLVLLRDKDDSIHLDIPITGDVNNPDFDPMDAVIKATSTATTVTLITFYTPYGLIYAGGNVLFDLATALNFEAIKFDTGTAEITDNNRTQLDKLSQLLKEKPGVHLTLCGTTSNEDTYSLYPALRTEKGSEPVTGKLTEQQKTGLYELAKQRQINVKKYLIEQFKISHDRLILCEPEHHANDENISGVEINI